MARRPTARASGYVVVNPAKAIIPTRAPVGPYPGQGTGGGAIAADFTKSTNSGLVAAIVA